MPEKIKANLLRKRRLRCACPVATVGGDHQRHHVPLGRSRDMWTCAFQRRSRKKKMYFAVQVSSTNENEILAFSKDSLNTYRVETHPRIHSFCLQLPPSLFSFEESEVKEIQERLLASKVEIILDPNNSALYQIHFPSFLSLQSSLVLLPSLFPHSLLVHPPLGPFPISLTPNVSLCSFSISTHPNNNTSITELRLVTPIRSLVFTIGPDYHTESDIIVSFLNQIDDSDILAFANPNDLVLLFSRCAELSLVFPLARGINQMCTLVGRTRVRIPGRICIDVVSLCRALNLAEPNCLGTNQEDGTWNVGRFVSCHLTQLNQLCNGRNVEDVLEENNNHRVRPVGALKQTAKGGAPEFTKRLKRTRETEKQALDALHGGYQEEDLPFLLLHLPQEEAARLVRECAANVPTLAKSMSVQSQAGLEVLNWYLSSSSRTTTTEGLDSCSLVRPARVRIQANWLLHHLSNNHDGLCFLLLPHLSSFDQDDFLSVTIKRLFFYWVTALSSTIPVGGRQIDFTPVLDHLSSETARALFTQTISFFPSLSSPLQLGFLRLFQPNWLSSSSSAAACEAVGRGFERLVQGNELDLARRVFEAIRNQHEQDVFLLTPPTRWRLKMEEWRLDGARLAPSSIQQLELVDVFSLWISLFQSWTGMNTICYAVGFLFSDAPPPLVHQPGSDVVPVAFLTALLSCVFTPTRFHLVPTFALLVKHTSRSFVPSSLSSETAKQLELVVSPSSSFDDGGNFLVHLYLYLLLHHPIDSASIRPALLALTGFTEEEMGCFVAIQLQSSSCAPPPTGEAEEVERYLLMHLKRDCVTCHVSLDGIWKLSQLFSSSSTKWLILLAKRLEMGFPATSPQLAVLAKRVCASLFDSEEEAGVNAKLRVLGAICFRGAKSAVMDHLDWSRFIATLLPHHGKNVRTNALVLLVELTSKLPPVTAKQQPESCFVNKREDVLVFHVERTHKLGLAVLRRVALEVEEEEVWNFGVDVAVQLLGLYVGQKYGGGEEETKLELAKGVLEVILGMNDKRELSDGGRRLTHLIDSAIQVTPLLHLIKQGDREVKSKVASCVNKFVTDQSVAARMWTVL